MAENVVINIEANTQGLESTIQLLTKLGVVEQKVADDFAKANTANVAQLNKGVAETAKSFDKLATSVKSVKADNGLAKALDVAVPAAKAGQAVMSLKAQLKEAKDEVERLTIAFGPLDERTKAAAKNANELQKQIGDINKQISSLSPEGKFQAIQKLGASIQGIFQVATGVIQTFGVESEAATKIAQQFQGALNVVAGVSQLEQLGGELKNVASALGLVKTETITTTAAIEGEAAASTLAAESTTKLSTSLTATGWGTVIVALAAIGTAIYAIANNADDAAEKLNTLKSLSAIDKAGIDAQLKSLERQAKIEIDGYNTRIKIAELEGKSAEFIGNIQREKIEAERKYINLKLQANQDGLNADIEAYNNALKLNTDEGKALAKELSDRIEARRQYSQDLQVEGKALVNENKVQEAQITKNKKDEEAKRLEGAKQAKQKEKELTGDEGKKKEFDRSISLINQYYAEQELLIKKSGKTKEEIDNDVTDNNILKLNEQIEAAKKNYQDYTQLEIQLQELLNKRTDAKGVTITAPKLATESTIPAEVKTRLELLDQVKQQFQDESIKAATDTLDAYFQTFIDGATMATDAQLNAIDVEEKSLQESYDRRLIGKREFDIQEKQLNDKKDALEKQRKRQQAAAEKEKALFDIAVNTATAIIKAWINPGFPLAPGTIATILATAGIQAAAVLAQPIPKFKTGTLAVGGTGTEDSIHAMLQPGEAVIPTETNKKYHPAIAAIYHNKIKAEDINSWVNMRLKGDYTADGGRSMTARMDTADMYQLGRIMKKNDGVYIKNIDELAGIFASLHNPRR